MTTSDEWEGQVRRYLELVKRYDKIGNVPSALLDSAYSVVCEAPDLTGTIALFSILINEYPGLIHHFKKGECESGDDSSIGALSISQDEGTHARTLASVMQCCDKSCARAYQ